MKRIFSLCVCLVFALGCFCGPTNVHAQASLPRADAGRNLIRAKLATIELASFQIDNLPLKEAIEALSNAAKRNDPEKRGINFMVDPNMEVTSVPANPAAQAQPLSAAEIESLPISVKLRNDITLESALKAMLKVAGPPRLKYTIEDFAVVIYPTSEAIPLETRVFKVDPNTFKQGLHSVGTVPFANVTVRAGNGGGSAGGNNSGQSGAGGASTLVTVPRVQVAPPQGGIPNVTVTNNLTEVQLSVRNFVQALGIDMSPPKSVFFNDRQGSLVVHATPADLELIETALVGR